MVLDAECCRVTTGLAGRHTPPTETRTQRSTARGIVEDHAATLSGYSRIVTWDLAGSATRHFAVGGRTEIGGRAVRFRARSLNLIRCRASVASAERNILMPKYRVTLRHTTIEIVEADNPYQAAVVASSRHGDGVEIADVRQAFGRPPSTTRKTAAKKTAKKATKKVAKKRRPMSPEARAKLAQNLVKARAARARNLKAARKSTKQTAAKKAKRTVKSC